jgi:ankyrin repeat protein
MKAIRIITSSMFMKKRLLIFVLTLIGQSLFGQQFKDKSQDIHQAVASGDLNKVRTLLEADPSLLELKDINGRTPLMVTCSPPTWKVEVANFLFDKGAVVNVRGALGFTPLHFAHFVPEGNLNLIQRLIDKGADVNAQGDNGITPLHYAALMGNIKVARLLIDNGAKVNPYDKYNGELNATFISGTVLQVAINYSPNEEIAKLLVENGAKLNLKDYFGNTELHLAALKGYTELVQLLIKHGSEVNAVNDYNHTALYYATKHGYRSVADILIASGANVNSIAETNYGKARQLTAKLKEGEALLWYLRGGFVVKTKGHLLVFLMNNIIDQSPEASLSNGRLNPDELVGQKITVFINNNHAYQMGAEDFKKLAKQLPDARIVLSFNPNIGNIGTQDLSSYRVAIPRDSFSVDGIQVHTIPALGGGLGYLIEVDGVKIFDASQHVSDGNPSNMAEYRKEINFLKPFGPIDIAIMSVHIHGIRVGVDYGSYLYLLDQLSPKAVYLTDANLPQLFKKCNEFLSVSNIPVYYPEGGRAMGERFHYIRK